LSSLSANPSSHPSLHSVNSAAAAKILHYRSATDNPTHDRSNTKHRSPPLPSSPPPSTPPRPSPPLQIVMSPKAVSPSKFVRFSFEELSEPDGSLKSFTWTAEISTPPLKRPERSRAKVSVGIFGRGD
jgi:hypothetical protein